MATASAATAAAAAVWLIHLALRRRAVPIHQILSAVHRRPPARPPDGVPARPGRVYPRPPPVFATRDRRLLLWRAAAGRRRLICRPSSDRSTDVIRRRRRTGAAPATNRSVAVNFDHLHTRSKYFNLNEAIVDDRLRPRPGAVPWWISLTLRRAVKSLLPFSQFECTPLRVVGPLCANMTSSVTTGSAERIATPPEEKENRAMAIGGMHKTIHKECSS